MRIADHATAGIGNSVTQLFRVITMIVNQRNTREDWHPMDAVKRALAIYFQRNRLHWKRILSSTYTYICGKSNKLPALSCAEHITEGHPRIGRYLSVGVYISTPRPQSLRYFQWVDMKRSDLDRSITHSVTIELFHNQTLWSVQWVNMKRSDLDKSPRHGSRMRDHYTPVAPEPTTTTFLPA